MTLTTEHSVLQNNPLLSRLDAQDYQQLRQHAEILSLNKGDTIYRQDQPAHHLGFVLSGAVKLYRLTQDGQEKVFCILGSGDSFAESMLFAAQSVHPCTAQAVENAEVMLFPLADFRHAVENNPELALALLNLLAEMESYSLASLEILSFKKSIHRVVRYLLSQALRTCQQCDAVQFELPGTKRLIASQLSIQPETLSRILNQLEREGLLILEGRRICILDLDALVKHD